MWWFGFVVDIFGVVSNVLWCGEGSRSDPGISLVYVGVR